MSNAEMPPPALHQLPYLPPQASAPAPGFQVSLHQHQGYMVGAPPIPGTVLPAGLATDQPVTQFMPSLNEASPSSTATMSPMPGMAVPYMPYVTPTAQLGEAAPPNIGFSPANQFPAAPPPYPGPMHSGYGKSYEPVANSLGSGTEDDTTHVLQDWEGFSNKEIRRSFVRKVYAILMMQLAITVGVVALFLFEPRVKHFVQTNTTVYISAYISFLATYIVLICCSSVRRTYPGNLILLFIFTLMLSYLVGVISSFHETDTVLMAGGISAACCLAVSLFSMHSKFDFTSCAGFLFIAAWILVLFGILTIFTYNRILDTVYSALGALLFMAFLAFDTQMIMGGRKLELNPEEHIFAALQLYMDVVQLFLFILRLIGGRR